MSKKIKRMSEPSVSMERIQDHLKTLLEIKAIVESSELGRHLQWDMIQKKLYDIDAEELKFLTR